MKALVPALLLILFNSTAALSWTLTPMKLERKLKPGETVTDVLVVDNSGASETKRFEIKAVDWALDGNGDLIYSEPGEKPNSLSAHIICTPMQFKCAPGERKLVRYTLTLPTELPPGEHCLGLQALEVVIPSKDSSTGKINVGVAVKCGFLCAMSVLTEKIDFKPLEARSLNYTLEKNCVDLQIKNNSNVRARPLWSFKLLNEKGMCIEETEPADYLVLRESERTISVPLKTNLSPGQYKLIGKLDQGVNFPVQELEKDFEVSQSSTPDSKATKSTNLE